MRSTFYTAILIGSGSLTAAAVSAPDVSAFMEWGLAGIVIAFVLLRDVKREDQALKREKILQKTIQDKDAWIQAELVTLLNTTIKTIEKFIADNEETQELRERVLKILESKEAVNAE